MNKFDMNSLTGLASGFEKLDAVTNGWQNGNLIVIAGRPAMGKTAFALSLVRNMAIEKKIPVAMFSLEMTDKQLVNRLLVNVSEISREKIASGQLEQYEWEQLDTKMRKLSEAPFYVDDTPSLSVSDLRTRAQQMVNEYHVRMIIIDYVQLMTASDKPCNSRQEEMTLVSHALKSLAKELNIPIIVLSQLNRPIHNTDDIDPTRPRLCDLRESKSLADDADMVCFIHRPEYYQIYRDLYGYDMRGIAEIIIAKNLHGDVCDVRLSFDKEHAAFMNETN